EQCANALLAGVTTLHCLEHTRVRRFDADLDRAQARGLHAIEQVFVEIVEMGLADPLDVQPRGPNAVGDFGASLTVEREQRIAKQDALRLVVAHEVLELGDDVGRRALSPLARGPRGLGAVVRARVRATATRTP